MCAAAGQPLKFVWNPALCERQQWPDWVWPGNDVVDVVATDAYGQSWDAGTTSAPNVAIEPAMSKTVIGDHWGAQHVADFAAKHDRPYAFPELGVGTRPDGHGAGDDGPLVQALAPLTAKAVLTGLWDFRADDYNGLFSDGSKPKALAAYKAVFAKPAPVASVPTFGTTVSDGAAAVVTANSDGSGIISLAFPRTAGSHHYTNWLSAPRQVETWGAHGVARLGSPRAGRRRSTSARTDPPAGGRPCGSSL